MRRRRPVRSLRRPCGHIDRKATQMINLVSVLDSQIFSAYQQVKKARAESDYAAMIRWMLFVDRLLDRRGVT